ncbi:MAG: hypothetical protein FVQ77_06265 [Cytophagales bacterium]|nr:hypothetical protein [Cytophagales bacterium]
MASKTMKSTIQQAKKQLESLIITLSEVRGIGIVKEKNEKIIEIAVLDTKNIPAKLLEIIPNRFWKGIKVKITAASEVIPFERE